MPLRAISLALLLLSPSLARAQGCPRPAGASGGVAFQSDAARLEFLASRASLEAAHLGLWKLVFGGAFGALVVGQLAGRPLFSPETGVDYYWGAAYSALGFTSTLLAPPEVYSKGAAFAAEAAGASEERRCELIAEGERLFTQGLELEAFGGRWFIHVINVAVNLSLGLILGLAYGHWTTAVLDVVVGTALSETMVITKPAGLVSGWQEYTSGGSPVTLLPMVSPGLQGGLVFGLGGRF